MSWVNEPNRKPDYSDGSNHYWWAEMVYKGCMSGLLQLQMIDGELHWVWPYGKLKKVHVIGALKSFNDFVIEKCLLE